MHKKSVLTCKVFFMGGGGGELDLLIFFFLAVFVAVAAKPFIFYSSKQ